MNLFWPSSSEEAFLPDTIHVASCNGGQATLLWASGIETSLVEFYNLEYADTNKIWNGELVRNPGRVKLVKKTLTSLQPGVWYQFRLRPQTDPETPRYAAGNCTVRIGKWIVNLQTNLFKGYFIIRMSYLGYFPDRITVQGEDHLYFFCLA